jgi:hypothetical protein
VAHGTEFTSKALEEWAWKNGVKLDFIHPEKPAENGHRESFNGRLRDECLIVHQFLSLEDARDKIEAWRIDYNQQRPHTALGHRTPSECASQRQDNQPLQVTNFKFCTGSTWGQRQLERGTNGLRCVALGRFRGWFLEIAGSVKNAPSAFHAGLAVMKITHNNTRWQK